VYSIGATALSMLTGRQPEDLPHKGLAIDVRAALGDRGDERLADALTLMLDPDPDQRPARIAPVLEKLERGAQRRGPASDPSLHLEGPLRSLIGERLKQQAAEYEERAYEYEDRASQGGPGARGWRRAAEGWHKGARKLRMEAHRHLVREAREADQRERRRLRKEARRAERARRRGSNAHPPPWPLAMVFSIVFALGMVAVAIATQVVVPALLRFLSIFFATRGLTAAANAVREAGEDAMSGIDRSRRWFRGGVNTSVAEPDDRVRVATPSEANVRVEHEPEAVPADDEGVTEARKASR
jgi:hypothetical protein